MTQEETVYELIEGQEVEFELSQLFSQSIDNQSEGQTVVLPTQETVDQRGQYSTYIHEKMFVDSIYPGVDYDSDSSIGSNVSQSSLVTNPRKKVFSYDHICDRIKETHEDAVLAARQEFGSHVILEFETYQRDCWWQLINERESYMKYRITKPKVQSPRGSITRGTCSIASISGAHFEAPPKSLSGAGFDLGVLLLVGVVLYVSNYFYNSKSETVKDRTNLGTVSSNSDT